MLLTRAGIGYITGWAQLAHCRTDRGNALEDTALEHVSGLDFKFAFQGEHHVHAGVRSHAGLVEVGVGPEAVRVFAEAAVLLEDAADGLNGI